MERYLISIKGFGYIRVIKESGRDITVVGVGSQISAIEALKANGMFDELSEELQTTAELRLENQESSLTELAALHIPNISKSGLNHRLSKILEIARQRKLI